jgi:hypothetical protein
MQRDHELLQFFVLIGSKMILTLQDAATLPPLALPKTLHDRSDRIYKVNLKQRTCLIVFCLPDSSSTLYCCCRLGRSLSAATLTQQTLQRSSKHVCPTCAIPRTVMPEPSRLRGHSIRAVHSGQLQCRSQCSRLNSTCNWDLISLNPVSMRHLDPLS